MSMASHDSITAILLLEEGTVYDCDSETAEMFCCSRQQLLGSDFLRQFSAPFLNDGRDSLSVIDTYLGRALANEPQYFPWRFVKADGSLFNAEVSLKKRNFNGKTYLQAVIIDISEKNRTNEALLVQKSYFQQLFENSPEAIVITNGATIILNINHSFEQYFQYTYQESVGHHLHHLIVPPDKLAEARDASDRVIRGEKPQGETVRRRKDGSLIDVAYMTLPVVLDHEVVGYYIIYNDITARKKAEEKLKFLSLHDPLTGLYNRFYFEQQLECLQANRPQCLGILACDIDGLKIINDTLGHHTGDEILVNTSKLIARCLDEEAVLARMGGDEFAVLLPGYSKEATERVIERIRDSIEGYNITSMQIPISISLGYSVIEEGFTENLNQLYIEADNNMYRDKLHRGKSARSAIVQTLMAALEARDFITEGHADRLQHLVMVMAEALGLSERTVNELRLLAQFHDIGKVGIPDNILFKPGPLTQEERKIIQRHSEIGSRIAQSAPDLAPISDWILKHHEWFNGNGYPLGLKGKDIPLECRILAIADTYDAMTSDRPYRIALTPAEAVREICQCSGTQFDPDLVQRIVHVLERMPAKPA